MNGCGEIVVEGFTQEIRKKVKNNLSDIAKKLKTSLTNRMKHLQVVEDSAKAFSMKNCIELIKAEEFQDDAKERLLLSVSNSSIAVTLDEFLPGYIMFLKFVKRKKKSWFPCH